MILFFFTKVNETKAPPLLSVFCRATSKFLFQRVLQFFDVFVETSRERPKSAPYLRLKNNKRTSKCQVFSSTVPVWGKIEKKIRFFFEFFKNFLVSRKSHSAELCKMGPFGSFLTSILLQNRQKNEGWALWRYLRKKSHKAEKNCPKNFGHGGTRTHVVLLVRPRKSRSGQVAVK